MSTNAVTSAPGMPAADSTVTAGKWMALTAALLGWMFDGFEMGLFPLVARPALLELMGPEASKNIGTWLSGIIATFLIGAAAGGILFGWLGDRVGRVRAMVWSVFTYAVFSGLCGFAQSPWHLAVLRFIAALGMGGEWSLGVALVMEIWPSSSRTLLAGLIGAAANFGYLLVALVGLGLALNPASISNMLHSTGLPETWIASLLGKDNSAWRLLMFIGAAPAVLTFFIRLFVPESERWKHAAANAPKARVTDIFQGGLARSTILGTCLGAVALLGTWGSIQWAPSWADKLSKEELKKREEVLSEAKATDATVQSLKAGAAIVRVNEQKRTVAGAKAWTQIASSIGAIIGTILAAFLAEWFSRRIAYFGLCLASLAFCAYLFRASLHFDGEFLAMIGIVGGLTASFYGWLPLYLPELFPTRVRATGQGFAFNFGRVLAAAGTLASGQLLNRFNEDYARTGAVTSLIYLVGLVLIWFCPETKGKPLPE